MEESQPSHAPIHIEQEMRSSYLDYAMSVIIGRALPDVRDGLKPVHRRALYTMYELKNNWNSTYKKSARIVGDCIGKYHPHGDQAVYDTVVRMAQNFSMRYPLVDGQGNFGSVDGDPAAAMRYTEVRMARIAHELLADLDKDTVEFGLTYDESGKEPLVLPTKVPHLLINGSSGIAVGMATNIPPHNINETIEACIALLDDPNIGTFDLMTYIPGPDFPTGGIIYGKQGIVDAYRTGRGVIRLRACVEVEEDSRGNESLIVTELPYQVNKARLLEKIAHLVRDKRIEGIRDLRDESDRQGMRMVIELKRDAQANVVLNTLFKMTALQSSFGINNLAIVQGEPKILALKEFLAHFLDHRRDVTLRRCRYELGKARVRAHLLEGFEVALNHIDEVIKVIRSSPSADEAKISLMSRFSLSDEQAKAILDMRLRRLTAMERGEIEEELAALREEIRRLVYLIENDDALKALIREELVLVRDQYGDERRTQIIADAATLDLEDLIPLEDMVVTVTHGGYIKRVPLTEYNAQNRGGRGKSGMATKDNDYVEHLFVASSHSYMLFFTDKGQVFKERVFHLPAGSRQSRGKPLNNVIPLDPKEKLAMVLAVREFSEGNSILFVTAQGKVKKTDLMAYSKVRSTGIRAITLADDDRLIAVRATNGSEHIMLATKKCKVIRFDESDARQMGRGASGVRGIKLKEESDEVVGCITFNPEDDEQISVMTITEYGHGKRTPLNQFRLQRRGGSGIIGIRPRMRNGDVVGIILIESEEDEYLVVTNQGVIMRGRANAVRVIGRNTSGVKLMRVPKGASVVSIARYAAAPDEEGDELDGEELIIPEGLESALEDAEYDDEEDDEGEEEIDEDEDEIDED
jgi:DNA gyrase subunit A